METEIVWCIKDRPHLFLQFSRIVCFSKWLLQDMSNEAENWHVIGWFYYMNITFQYIALEISFRESLTTFIFLMLCFFINEMFFKKPKTLCRHVFFSEFLCFNLFYIKWDEKHKAIKISHKVRKSLPMYSAITQS